jgi:thiol-disulfide isomerase/thioredoxin
MLRFADLRGGRWRKLNARPVRLVSGKHSNGDNAMNARKLMIPVFFLLLAVSGLARALDIQPYTANALQQAQASGKPVAVHFHADWCSTCKAQEQAFNSLRGDPQLKGITLLVANYDNERELKQAMNVRSQSIVVVFRGKKETARIGGETKPEKIKAALVTAL